MKGSYFIVIYATILQLITAAFVLLSPNQIRVARLGVFYDLFSITWIGGLLMIASVAIAIIGMFKASKYRFLYFLPQYFFLLLTAGSAMYYVMQSHYADGVIRPWQFIFIDQLPSLITTSLYIFSILDFRKEGHGS